MSQQPIFKSAFTSPMDGANGQGVRPVVFDIIATDGETSLLPDDIKLVLHVNPTTMSFQYQKVIERIQTKGGFVEQHWGDGPGTMSLEMATGGFMRLYSGLSSTTGANSEEGLDIGGTRRDTIAYDKYLDMLALFHNNGSVFDQRGSVAFQGMIRVTFDEGTYYGNFSSFTVTESAEKPYQFALSGSFQIRRETFELRTTQFAGLSGLR